MRANGDRSVALSARSASFQKAQTVLMVSIPPQGFAAHLTSDSPAYSPAPHHESLRRRFSRGAGVLAPGRVGAPFPKRRSPMARNLLSVASE